MGLQIEFNTVLVLKDIDKIPNITYKEECIPNPLYGNCVYEFYKKERRIFQLDVEIPLVITYGEAGFSDKKADIEILNYEHIKIGEEIWTRGKFRVIRTIYDYV